MLCYITSWMLFCVVYVMLCMLSLSLCCLCSLSCMFIIIYVHYYVCSSLFMFIIMYDHYRYVIYVMFSWASWPMKSDPPRPQLEPQITSLENARLTKHMCCCSLSLVLCSLVLSLSLSLSLSLWLLVVVVETPVYSASGLA